MSCRPLSRKPLAPQPALTSCVLMMALLSAEDEVKDVGRPVRLELARITGEPAEVLIG